MADYKICRSPQVISTLGLGSCLGVVLYDESSGVCGLAHVMLPDSTRVPSQQANRFKFMDTCLKDMYDELTIKNGIPASKLRAKIAGGAQMFAFQSNDKMMRVGERNVEAVKKKLSQLGIRLIAEDTGANYGRTVIFYPETGDFVIRAVGKPEKTI